MANNTTYPEIGFAANITTLKCQKITEAPNIAYVIFLCFVLVLTLLGNSFVCLTIVLCHQLRRHITNYFIFFLAISDIGVGVFVLPFRIFMALHNGMFCADKGYCVLHVILDTTCSVASVTNLFIIALDRRCMITMPYKYPVLMSRQRAIVISLSVWVYAHLWSWSSIYSWNEKSKMSIRLEGHRCQNINKYFLTVFLILVYFIPLSIMGAVYGHILRIAKQQARGIKRLEINRKCKDSRKRARERKATKTLSIIYGAFVICWLPNCILGMASTHCPICFRNLLQHNKALFMFLHTLFVEILPPLSSTMNPFIYAIFNKQFRNAFKEFILRRRAATLLDSDNNVSRIPTAKRNLAKWMHNHRESQNGSRIENGSRTENGSVAILQSENDDIYNDETKF